MFVVDRSGSMCQDSNGNDAASVVPRHGEREVGNDGLPRRDGFVHRPGRPDRVPAGIEHQPEVQHGVDNSNYNSASAPYLIVPLSSDYKAPGPTGAIKSSSNLVSTINCIQAGGGTAYATAIDKARTDLETNGRANAWKVIIFLSDGAANEAPSYYANNSPYRTQPCHQGIASAQTARNEKFLIYSIGYDLNATAAGSNICENANTQQSGVADDHHPGRADADRRRGPVLQPPVGDRPGRRLRPDLGGHRAGHVPAVRRRHLSRTARCAPRQRVGVA